MGFYVVPAGSNRRIFRYDETTWKELSFSRTSRTQYAMAAPPDAPNTVYLAASDNVATRLYTSLDAGENWTSGFGPTIFPEQVVNETRALQLEAKSSTELFCWNGDSFSETPGVHRSTDGGATWSQIITLTLAAVGWGMFALGTNKLFYAQIATTYPSALNQRWGEYKIWRASLDGSAQEIIATILVGPSTRGGGFTYAPGALLLRALSDNSVLACSRYGSSKLGVNLVPPGDVTLTSTTSVALGSPVLITPESRLDGTCTIGFRVHFDASSLNTGRYRLEYQYQNDDGTWSARVTLVSGEQAPVGGWDWWMKDITVPCGTRALQFSIGRTSTTTYTLFGFRVDEAFDAGLLLRVDASGTVTDVRPPTLRRPFDVLPLTATRWIATGTMPVEVTSPQPVTVMRTDNAGSTWTLTQTIPVGEGFNVENARIDANSALLARRFGGSTYDVVLMGAASTTVQERVWLTETAGSVWTEEFNAADIADHVTYPGFLVTGGVRQNFDPCSPIAKWSGTVDTFTIFARYDCGPYVSVLAPDWTGAKWRSTNERLDGGAVYVYLVMYDADFVELAHEWPATACNPGQSIGADIVDFDTIGITSEERARLAYLRMRIQQFGTPSPITTTVSTEILEWYGCHVTPTPVAIPARLATIVG